MVNYPASLDTLTNPATSDNLNTVAVPHATQHANANDILEALEAKVGIGSATPSSGLFLTGAAGSGSTWSAHNVAAAVHGLPASVNVLGSRTAAGLFTQHGSAAQTDLGTTDIAVYVATVAVTYANAYGTIGAVVLGGCTEARGHTGSAFSVTTIGFTAWLIGGNAGPGSVRTPTYVAIGTT